MAMDQAFDITPEQRESIISLLSTHLPDTEAWAYDSRVRWTSRPESDLDMVVFAKPEQARSMSDLREAFEESNLPFRVDLFVWDEVPESFRVDDGQGFNYISDELRLSKIEKPEDEACTE